MRCRQHNFDWNHRWTIIVLIVLGIAGCCDQSLINSIKARDTRLSEKLIADKTNLNATDSSGKTALHAAIEVGDKKIYKELLEAGADPNICDNVGTSVIHAAAEQSDVYWIQLALRHGGDPNRLNVGNRHTPNSTPIFYALNAHRSATALELIEYGADVNHLDHFQESPLVTAMGSGMYDVMIQLIKSGADPRRGKVKIFSNGWFSEGYEKLIDDEPSRIRYAELKALLIEKGFLVETQKN